MGRSGGGSFGGGFSSGSGFGGSFSGGERFGGRSDGGDFSGGGHSDGSFGGSFLDGFLIGRLLSTSHETYSQPLEDEGNSGGSGGSGGSSGPGGGSDGSNKSPSNGGLSDPNSKSSSGFGCIFIIIAFIVIMSILVTFAGGCSSIGIPDSTVDRTALPAGTAEVSEYYTDEDGDWIHNSAELESGLEHFYDETGVWPYVYILPNGYTTSSSQLQSMAENIYREKFTDDAHFVLVFCDNNQGGYNCGYYGGNAARSVLDDEAVSILAAYLELNYNDYSLDEEEIFSNTFSQTADHIMSKTVSPWIFIAIATAVIIIVIVIAILVKRKQDAKRREAERMERILNTPLEEFGDRELNDLEKKYTNTEIAAEISAEQTQVTQLQTTQTAPSVTEEVAAKDSTDEN